MRAAITALLDRWMSQASAVLDEFDRCLYVFDDADLDEIMEPTATKQ